MSTALELVSQPGPWSWCNKAFRILLDHWVPIFLAHIWCVAGLNTKEMLFNSAPQKWFNQGKKRKQKKILLSQLECLCHFSPIWPCSGALENSLNARHISPLFVEQHDEARLNLAVCTKPRGGGAFIVGVSRYPWLSDSAGTTLATRPGSCDRTARGENASIYISKQNRNILMLIEFMERDSRNIFCSISSQDFGSRLYRRWRDYQIEYLFCCARCIAGKEIVPGNGRKT